MQLSRKAIEHSVYKRAKYITKIASRYTNDQLVFVDESSADQWTTYCGYAWALEDRGQSEKPFLFGVDSIVEFFAIPGCS